MGHHVFKKIKHGFHHLTHGVEHVFHSIGHVVEKITPWNDHTFLGKILDTALGVVGGYYAGGALGLWNTGGAATSVATGGMSTLGGTTLSTGLPNLAGIGGIGDVASVWSEMPAMSTLPASTAASIGSSGSLFGSVLNTAEHIGGDISTALHLGEAANDFRHHNFFGGLGDIISGATNSIWSGISKIGAGIGDFAKEHPLLAGSLASGILQGIGGYMQAEQQQKNFEQMLAERQREFDERHNMHLTVTPGTYQNPYNAVVSANVSSVYNEPSNNTVGRLFSNMNWQPNFNIAPGFFSGVHVGKIS